METGIEICEGTDAEKRFILEAYPYTTQVLKDGGHLLIAACDGEILGFSWSFQRKIPAPVEKTEDFINVIEVFKTEDRCKGIGSRLVQAEIRFAREHGFYQVRAYCDIGNIPSHRLWVKNGFSISPVKTQDDRIIGSYVAFAVERV